MSNATQLSAILEQQYELFDTIKESLDKLGSNPTTQRIESRKNALCENWTLFKESHQSATSIKASLKVETRQKFEEENYFKNKMYRSCEENYLDAIEHMSTLKDKLSEVPNLDGKALAATSAKPQILANNHQLPKLPLPVFNGEFSEWPSFKDSFMAIIGADPSLSCVTKLQFLKGCLIGKAASRLHGVSVTASNFQIAWDDMISYYDNKRLHVDAAVQAIISAKAVNEESSSKLETLFNDINKALGSLEGLGRDVNQWNDVLTHIVSRKLDGASIKEWEKSLGPSTEPPTWAALKEFILTRIRSLEAFERATSSQNKSQSSSSRQQVKAKAHHAAAQQTKQVCFNCQGEHYISSCPGFLSKTLANRLELIKQLKLCFNCLGPHQLNTCFSKRRCQKCGRRHHTTIHQENTFINSTVASNEAIPSNSINCVSAVSSVTCTTKLPRSTTLLATALVKVVSSFGESYLVRAFLDQGSEVNLVSEYLINLLQLPRSYTSLSIVGIGGDSSSSHQSKGMVTINLKSCTSEFTCSFNAYILSKLTNLLPSAVSKHSGWAHLQNIDLADPEYHQPGRVDLILGVEMYGQVLQNGLIKGPEGAPIAQRTSLGWIISGSSTSIAPSEAKSFHCCTDDHLDDLVQKFWMQEESFKSSVDTLTPEEEECEHIFQSTHSRDAVGRFIVRLPFKSVPASFGDSRSPALKCLSRLKNRFVQNTEFAIDYSNFITEYEQLGHMQRVPTQTQNNDQMFYLPHHCVLRSCSSTTKLRVVFNGSLKTDKGKSLNGFLHEGKKLQVDLPDVLTRWRVNEFAYCADVKKMFRQIKVHPDDWNYQRILWTEGSNIQEFVLTTVTYGTKSAPFLANRVLHQLAEDESYRFADVKDVIKKNTYVDDVYDGAATVQEGKNRISQITHLFEAGGFQLQKWAANNKNLIANVPEQNRATAPLLSIEDSPVHRTLGLNWQPTLDRFIFIPVHQQEPALYTKRTVLSRAAQLFDPLGWLSPIVVEAKLFIQELWLAGFEWDQPISKSFESRWKSYINQLSDLSMISVPRWLGITPCSLSIELHGFSDASQLALGAVVYIRVVKENETNITILSSKTKVAPTKRSEKSLKRPRSVRVTIPRLELTAALMLTKLVKHVVYVLDLHAAPIHLWTDSSTALYWIQGEPSRWKDFVRNRVTQIQEILPKANWHHISGEHNPADLPSRGVSPRQLAESDLWWKGPRWLQLTSDKWPNLIPAPDSNVDHEERHTLVATTIHFKNRQTWDLLLRYSSLSRLLRITAWCKRAILRNKMRVLLRKATNKSTPSSFTSGEIENAKLTLSTSTNECPLTPLEIETAKSFWIRKIQLLYFKTEINQQPSSSAYAIS
ncbi:uncharacterized protein LOC129944915 [Eupeodes corollae]|uniref:uncharacterized protein LOC129944915 n=1 Tax=Eupeodes corollae TaxID=290404 RepID=UPI002492B119|nr:uncharacterized protein LOC129944915 [Eupeodes corollae]